MSTPVIAPTSTASASGPTLVSFLRSANADDTWQNLVVDLLGNASQEDRTKAAQVAEATRKQVTEYLHTILTIPNLVMDSATKRYFINEAFDLEAWRSNVEGKQRRVGVTISNCVEAVRAASYDGKDVPTSAIVAPLHEMTGVCAKTIQRRIGEAERCGYLQPGSKRGTWRIGPKPLKA